MNTSYGSRVKNKRISMGLKQKELATLINMPQSQLSHIENDRRDPSLKNATKIASVLGTIKEVNSVTEEQYGGVIRLFHSLSENDKRIVTELLIRLQPEVLK